MNNKDDDDWSWQEHVNRAFPRLIIAAIIVLMLTMLVGFLIV